MRRVYVRPPQQAQSLPQTGLEAHPRLKRHINRINRAQTYMGVIRDDKLNQFSPTFFQQQMGANSTIVVMKHNTDDWISHIVQEHLGRYWQFNSRVLPYIVLQNWFHNKNRKKDNNEEWINQGQHLWIKSTVEDTKRILKQIAGRSFYCIWDIGYLYDAMVRRNQYQIQQRIRRFDSEKQAQIELRLALDHYRTAEEKNQLFNMIAGRHTTTHMKNRKFNQVHRVDIPKDIEAYDLTQFITEMARYFMPRYSDRIKQRVLQELADTDWSNEFYQEQYGTPYRFLKTEVWNNALSGAYGIMSKLEQGRKRMVQTNIAEFRAHMRQITKQSTQD